MELIITKETSTICYLTKCGKKELKTVLSDNLVKELANKANLLVGIEASGGVNFVVDQLKDPWYQHQDYQSQ